MQQKAKAVSDAAADAVKELSETLSAMAQPIYDAFEEFKKVPPMLNSIVDVQGAAAGAYADLAAMPTKLISKFQQNFTSAEVPITLMDYQADPSKYENLMAIEFQKNEVT